MIEEPEKAGEEHPRPVPVGLDDSQYFAADRVFEHLTSALQGAQQALNLAEVLRIQTVLAGWDAMVLDEQAHGRAVHGGGVQERAFGIHLGALLKLSPRGSLAVLRNAITLRGGLPSVWSAFQQGGFSWRSASLVADESTGLTGEALAGYDRRATELATELPPHVLRTELPRLHDELDAAVVQERAERAIQERHVSAQPDGDGGAVLSGHGPQTDVAAMYDVLRRVAVDAHGRDGETRSVPQLMFDLLADLVLHGAATPPVAPDDPATPMERLGDPRVPGRKAIEATLLVLTPAATACGLSEQPAKLAGWGSLSGEETRRIIASTTTWTRVLVDPVDDAILGIDSTERYIPSGLRKLLLARDQHCQGPGCNHSASGCDLDHTHRYEHGGHTAEVNLASLCRPSHQAKDDGYLHVRRQPDGSLLWRTRWGASIVTRPALTVRRVPASEPAPF